MRVKQDFVRMKVNINLILWLRFEFTTVTLYANLSCVHRVHHFRVHSRPTHKYTGSFDDNSFDFLWNEFVSYFVRRFDLCTSLCTPLWIVYVMYASLAYILRNILEVSTMVALFFFEMTLWPTLWPTLWLTFVYVAHVTQSGSQSKIKIRIDL